MIVPVSDADDPRLADYRNIPDPELLRRHGTFIAEGRQVVRRLLASRFRIRSLLVTPAAQHALADAIVEGSDLPVYVVSQEAMNRITGFNIHRGCLAVGERPPERPWRDVVAGAARAIVLERVANADNVGGIFRAAAAFDAGAVLLGPACADPLYRKTIRTSMGASLAVPFATLPDWPADLAALRGEGFHLLALTPDASATPIANAARTDRTAILAGHEGDGLTPEALAAAAQRVRIPMAAGVDSLNVATAVAIALYEMQNAQGSRAKS